MRLALGPSCCTADPRTAASSGSEETRKAPQPSPRQYPSPRRSNVWHRPCADSIPAAENVIDSKAASSPAPVTTAREQSSSLNAEAARCVATNEDEHAVSVVKHGPVSPSTYETRPESTESAPAVAECAEGASADAETSLARASTR